jgi:hypothetical protein
VDLPACVGERWSQVADGLGPKLWGFGLWGFTFRPVSYLAWESAGLEGRIDGAILYLQLVRGGTEGPQFTRGGAEGSGLGFQPASFSLYLWPCYAGTRLDLISCSPASAEILDCHL